METSKDRYDRTMDDVRAAKMDGMPTEAEVEEVEKEAKTMTDERPQKSHLTQEEKTLLTHLIKGHAENKITDPVLLQLLKMRESSKRSYIEKQSAMKTIYVGIMKELNDLSQGAIKLQGALENTDRQIIEFLKEQQSAGDNPPAA